MAIALNSSTLVTVFGGSGFIGRYVVQALVKTGCRVRVAVRRPDLALFVQPLGSIGQIAFVQANLRYEDSIRHAVEGADGVVNLVGVLQQSGKQTFRALQASGRGSLRARPARLAQGVRAHVGDRREPAQRSAYARTKAEGEDLVPGPSQARSSSGRRSCSGRRTRSSTALPPWRVCGRSCR